MQPRRPSRYDTLQAKRRATRSARPASVGVPSRYGGSFRRSGSGGAADLIYNYFANPIEVWDSVGVGHALVDNDVAHWPGRLGRIPLNATAVAQRGQFTASNAYFLGAPSVDCVTAKLQSSVFSLGLGPGSEVYIALVARRISDSRQIFAVGDAGNRSQAAILGRTVPVPFHSTFRSVESLTLDINLASSTPAAPHLFEAWFDGTHARSAIDGVEGTAVAASGMRESVTRVSIGSSLNVASLDFGRFEIRLAVLCGATTPSEIASFRPYAAGLHI